MRFFSILLIAMPLFAADSKTPEVKERIKAAKELSKQGSSSLTTLSTMILDAEPSVRGEAVKSIVAIGTQHSLDPLLRSIEDGDPEIQIRAIEGLVNFYVPGYVQTGIAATLKRTGDKVIGKFTDKNDQVIPAYVTPRQEVITALGKQIGEAKNMTVRATAARAVGTLRGKSAIDPLMLALRSKDDSLMYESVVAIEKIREPKSAGALIFLFRDPNERIQVAALEAAGLLLNKEVVPQLEETMERALTVKARRAALGALGQLALPSSRSQFERYLEDKDDGVRAAAAEGLGRLKNPADAQRMDALFNTEKKMPARMAQAFAVAAIGNMQYKEFSALKYLMDSLASKAWGGVAEAYVTELARLAEVREIIYQVMTMGPKDEKIRLSRVLSISGDKGTVDKLEVLTRDGDADVAQQALRSLRALKARVL